jgi:hypothetical protein
VCYACMVSFKKDEKKSDRESKTGHQMKESVWERFGEILQDVKPETLERCPNVDTPWWVDQIKHLSSPDFTERFRMEFIAVKLTCKLGTGDISRNIPRSKTSPASKCEHLTWRPTMPQNTQQRRRT